MKRRRRVHADGALDLSPPAPLDPEAFAAEARRLADEAAHGAELAELLALARAPLAFGASPSPGNPDPDMERAVEREAELVPALLAAAAATEATYAASRRPVRPRPRSLRVIPGEQIVLTASGQVVPGGYAAMQRWTRQQAARDRRRATLTAAATRTADRRRARSDERRRRFFDAVRIGVARSYKPDAFAKFILDRMDVR